MWWPWDTDSQQEEHQYNHNESSDGIPVLASDSEDSFQNVDGCKICFSCGHVANRQWCWT